MKLFNHFLLRAAHPWRIAILALCIVGGAVSGAVSVHAQGLSAQAQTGQTNQQPPSSKDAKRVDLGKFLGAATTPIGLIIAGAIMISFFEQKRTDAAGRLRALTAELRSDVSQRRSKSLIDQVEIYRCRLRYVRTGTLLTTTTIILFIVTNFSSSLALIWPDFKPFEFFVVGAMLLGMITLAGALLAEFLDAWREHSELMTEMEDYDRVVSTDIAAKDDHGSRRHLPAG